jgi:thiamine biosynthesis lipoprotein
MHEISFRAMGSDVHVVVVGGPAGLADVARRRIEELEGRWSRFRPDSEVCRLADRAGRATAVSAETRLLVERAIEAWWMSGGAFDPTVLGAVIRAGYDRSFDELGELGDRTGAGLSELLVVGCADIEVHGDMVRLPPGTGFDPGGIGKGLAADIVAGEILAAGVRGTCVNIGGDLRVAGQGPDDAGDGDSDGAGDGWTVAVDHPWSDVPIALLGLAAGAVATSTTLRRSWTVDGEPRHHLIDPSTGQPSTTDVTLATVLAEEAWMAEVLAKAVLLRGADRALDLVEATGVEALVVAGDGSITATAGLDRFLGAAPLPTRLVPPATVPTEAGAQVGGR